MDTILRLMSFLNCSFKKLMIPFQLKLSLFTDHLEIVQFATSQITFT